MDSAIPQPTANRSGTATNIPDSLIDPALLLLSVITISNTPASVIKFNNSEPTFI